MRHWSKRLPAKYLGSRNSTPTTRCPEHITVRMPVSHACSQYMVLAHQAVALFHWPSSSRTKGSNNTIYRQRDTSHQKTDGDHNDQKRAMFRYIQPAIMTVTGRTWRIGHSIKAFHKTGNNDIAYNPKKTSFLGLKQYFRNVNLPLN